MSACGRAASAQRDGSASKLPTHLPGAATRGSPALLQFQTALDYRSLPPRPAAAFIGLMPPFKGGDQEGANPHCSLPQVVELSGLPHSLPLSASSGGESDVRTWSHPHPPNVGVSHGALNGTGDGQRHTGSGSCTYSPRASAVPEPVCARTPRACAYRRTLIIEGRGHGSPSASRRLSRARVAAVTPAGPRMWPAVAQ